MTKKYFVVALVASCVTATSGQKIFLNNASFEGAPQDATVPIGWHGCEPGTTPDILPGPWGVYQEPAEGETYMGLITRDNGTWESVGQRLKTPLTAPDCYAFTFDLAHSDTYANYSQSIKIRVWGAETVCGKDQLLFESPLIEHTDWKTYEVRFTPEKSIRFIILEAFYSEKKFSRRGNVLIDNLSAITKCPRV